MASAERLLPEIESAIVRAVECKNLYEKAEGEVRRWSARVAGAGGVVVDHRALAGLHERREQAARQLREAVEWIHSQGCLVKDLDTGLVDFPTLFRGEEVYLCWRMGEPRIAFWHGVQEGFSGRKAIDRDFLDNHRGESVN